MTPNEILALVERLTHDLSRHRDVCAEDARQLLTVARECTCHSCEVLPTLHKQVAEMCEYLGSKREDVPCDSWHLRDLVVKLRARAEKAEAELAQVRRDARELAKWLKTCGWHLPATVVSCIDRVLSAQEAPKVEQASEEQLCNWSGCVLPDGHGGRCSETLPQPAEPAGESGELEQLRARLRACELSLELFGQSAAHLITSALSGAPVTVEEGPLREALERVASVAWILDKRTIEATIYAENLDKLTAELRAREAEWEALADLEHHARRIQTGLFNYLNRRGSDSDQEDVWSTIRSYVYEGCAFTRALEKLDAMRASRPAPEDSRPASDDGVVAEEGLTSRVVPSGGDSGHPSGLGGGGGSAPGPDLLEQAEEAWGREETHAAIWALVEHLKQQRKEPTGAGGSAPGPDMLEQAEDTLAKVGPDEPGHEEALRIALLCVIEDAREQRKGPSR